MAFPTVWYQTKLPINVADEIKKYLNQYSNDLKTSKIDDDNDNPFIRTSTNCWVNAQDWVASFVWYYVLMANRENFLYDIDTFENNAMQYTQYDIGHFYTWHQDADITSAYKPMILGEQYKDNTPDVIQNNSIIDNERVRKLTVSLQLSDYNEYTGGNLEFKDASDNIYIAPRNLGSIIIYDSRQLHQVTPIESGIRKSLVCWVVGPRWK